MADHGRYSVQVIEVSREQLDAHAGRNWRELLAEAEADPELLVRSVIYGDATLKQEARETWQPPRDRAGLELPWLPLNKAWLRQHDNRAFLYMQNW